MPNIFYDRAITPWAEEAVFGKLAGIANTNAFMNSVTSTSYPTGSMALYVPFYSQSPCLLRNAFWYVGATVTGSVDVGIYADGGRQLYHTGSILLSGSASALQSFTLPTPVEIGTGLFFLGLSASNTSVTLFATTLGNRGLCSMIGMYQQANAFPLPASPVFIEPVMDYLPIFGFTTRSLV